MSTVQLKDLEAQLTAATEAAAEAKASATTADASAGRDYVAAVSDKDRVLAELLSVKVCGVPANLLVREFSKCQTALWTTHPTGHGTPQSSQSQRLNLQFASCCLRPVQVVDAIVLAQHCMLARELLQLALCVRRRTTNRSCHSCGLSWKPGKTSWPASIRSWRPSGTP